MLLSLLVAVAENNVIGRDGGLPWHLSADLKRFKQLTMGHPIVMGRRTFESLGRVLPGRTSIVVSRQPQLALPVGVLLAGSLATALELVAKEAEVFIIGGAELYATALPIADRIYLTRVHANIKGDTYFPPVDWSQWRCVAEEACAADEKNAYDFTFLTYDHERKFPKLEIERYF
jgi:dihydrofolate reductase